MTNEEKLKNIKLRDRVVRAMDKSGKFRISCVKNTKAVQTAVFRHHLPAIPSFITARLMSAASMVASFQKGEERIVLEMESYNAISKVFCEAMTNGEVRAYANYAPNIDEIVFDSIEDVFGAGLFRISKILYDQPEPLVGLVPIMKGDVSTDLAYYYRQSEQIPTAVILDVASDDDGVITQSGGMIVQALPGASEEDTEKVHEHLIRATALTDLFDNEYTPDKVIRELLPFDVEIVGSTQVDFYCRCSKDQFISKLITLGENEIKGMKAENHNELVCQYCNEKYLLDEADFDSIISHIVAKKN